MSRTHGGPDGLHWNDPSLAFAAELEGGSPKTSQAKSEPTLADFMREQVAQGVAMAARANAGEYTKVPAQNPHVQAEDFRLPAEWVWHPGAV